MVAETVLELHILVVMNCMYAQFLHVTRFMMHYRFVDVAAHPTQNLSAAMDATGKVCVNYYTLQELSS